MKIEYLPQTGYGKSSWSGGITDQIFIWPPSSIFADRDFIWRVSKAALEAEHSVFTLFEEYERVLYLLTGNSRLAFEGHGEKMLHPGSQVQFSGSWKTESFGRASDLNLIMKKGTVGAVSGFSVTGEYNWIRPVMYGGRENKCCYLLYVKAEEGAGDTVTGKIGGQEIAGGDSVLIMADGREKEMEVLILGKMEAVEVLVCW